ncbi:MAG: flagellar assembly protein FliW [Candidatus Gastranaerophilales bacterium]|nr:flagellar assembly protein FliW [Candidatus Gastranaerophilales bacterium]MCM1073577.1 flagellar assembly protein FliW [Bacteroides sp.]
MKINTVRFGEIDIEEDRIFEFCLPIIGFNELKKFVILDLNKESFFKWLQSIEDPSIAFPVVSVFSLNVDYAVDLPDNVVDTLKIKNVESLLVMNIASIPQDNPQETTLNLLAPIIFNLDEQLAGQVILSGSGYDVSFPLFKKLS